MAGEKKPTPGVSSRRSACDRCRGQKLRCLRKGGDPQGRCDRCAKADTSCTTSPIYRMRNYSVEDDGNSVSRKRRRIGDRSSHPSQSPTIAAPAATLAPSRPAAQALPQPTPLTIPAAAQAIPTTAGSIQTSKWNFGDTTQASSNGGTVGFHFSIPPPTSGWSAFPNSATSAFSTPVVTSPFVWERCDITMAQVHTDPNTDKTVATSFNSTVGESMPQNTFPITHTHQALQSQQPHAPESMHWSQQHLQQEHVSDYFIHEDSNTYGMMSHSLNDLESRSHNHMAMLTSINLELVTQLKQVSLPHININILIDHQTAGNSELSSTSVFERILNSTQEFINILDVVAGIPNTPHTPLAAQATPMTTWVRGVYGDYASGSESASTSAYDSEINSPSENSSTTQYSPASASMSPQLSSPTPYYDNNMPTPTPRPTTDSATVLPHHHLLQSGNLQVTMVIQLVASAFERMEALLGLPSELCLGSCDGYDTFAEGQQHDHQQPPPTNPYLGRHAGMLEDAGLLDVARTIIGKEDLGRPEEGKGGVRSLRRAMMQARHSLQNRMGHDVYE
ncbi:hypothetical protein PG984_015491 [Apiospora sp. TS-2023a]